MFTVLAAIVVFSTSVVLLGFALARSSRTGCCNCQRAQGVMARCSAAAGLGTRVQHCDSPPQLTTLDAADSSPMFSRSIEAASR